MTVAYLPSFETAYFAAEWIIRIIMLFVVPLRRTPQAAQSWLLLIFFLPIPGLFLYLLIGRPRFPVWRLERFQKIRPWLDTLAPRLPRTEADDPAVSDLALRLGSLPAVDGNAVEFLDDYDATTDRLIADIDQASKSVRILVYIFADDPTGQRVSAALARAVQRGVSCHVLFDALGSRRWAKGTLRLLTAAGVDARKALPLRLLRGRTRGDMRNHRKLFLIDGEIGYAGSQNIIEKDFRPGVVNRELVLRVKGPLVAEMAAMFVVDWYMETEAMLEQQIAIPAPAGAAMAQVLPSGAELPLEGFETLLVWLLHRAEQRVIITTPYLIPDEDVLGAMRTAVHRGVKVDLIVSAVADQKLVSLAQRSYYSDLLDAGVMIHHFRDYLLHAKNVSFDDRLAIVGSSNVDIRSFQLNEEVSVILYDRASVERLGQIQQGYIAQSDLVDQSAWRRRSRLQKLTENLARLVSPLL
jgi:cardiolipin synthase